MSASPAASDRYRVLDAYARLNAHRRGALYGRVGYALKLLLATLAGILIGLLRRRRLPQISECDVLVLHGWGGGERYVAPLNRSLLARGLRVRHVQRASRSERLRRWLFWPPRHAVPLRWRLDAWYAGFLLRAHTPSVVVTFDNYSVFLPLLRLACAGRAQVVNVGHSVTPLHDNASMFDADYSLVFGPSSLEHCRRKRLRIGSTRVVEAGFVAIGEDFTIPPTSDRTTLLFFSQLSAELLASRLVAAAVKDLLFRNTGIILAFAREHPEYTLLVRRHPLEAPGLFESLAKGLRNVVVLPDEMSMPDAVSRASAGIVMWSNAALEVAALGRPLIVVNDTDGADEYLELERFFQPRARSAAALFDRVRDLYDRYDEHVRACEPFVHRHLAHVRDAGPFVAGLIEGLVRGRAVTAGEDLPERLDALGRDV